MSNFAKVSIIILNWDGLQDTIECLESLTKITYPNYEIIIVDNGSIDGSIETLKSKFPYIKMIENKINKGFAGGNNQGIKYAAENGATYLLLLNNDTVVAPDFLNELVKVAENHPEAGIIGPKIYDYKSNKIQCIGGKIDFCNLKTPFIEIGRGQTDNCQHNKIEDREWFTGCCWLAPIEVFSKVSLFDETSFFSYGEDTDLCYKVRRAGYRILYCPLANIWHKGGTSTGGRLSPLSFYFSTRNEITYMLKNGTARQKMFFISFRYSIYPILVLGYSMINSRMDLMKPLCFGLIYHLDHKERYYVPTSSHSVHMKKGQQPLNNISLIC